MISDLKCYFYVGNIYRYVEKEGNLKINKNKTISYVHI